MPTRNQLDFDKGRGGGGDNHERLPGIVRTMAVGRHAEQNGDHGKKSTRFRQEAEASGKQRERDRPLMVEEWSVGGAPSSSAASSCSGRQQIQGQGMEHGCSAVDPWLPRCSGVRARKRGGGRLAELRRRVCGEAETLRQGSERQRKTPDRWVPPVRTDEKCGQKRSLL
jgi:hypothetical protein